MNSDLFKEYPLLQSAKLREKLTTQEAVAWNVRALRYIHAVYANILKRLPDDIRNNLHRDPQLIKTAIDSAFLDLLQSEGFHELSEGPSGQRKGAALTCWINRFKPIQFKSNTRELTAPTTCVMLNSIFALEVGWSMMSYVDRTTAGVDIKIACGQIRQIIYETNPENTLLYPLLWRSPSFRELVPLFELLKDSR